MAGNRECADFLSQVLLCNPGLPGIYHINHAGLELTEVFVLASELLGLKGIHHHVSSCSF